MVRLLLGVCRSDFRGVLRRWLGLRRFRGGVRLVLAIGCGIVLGHWVGICELKKVGSCFCPLWRLLFVDACLRGLLWILARKSFEGKGVSDMHIWWYRDGED